eukprot:7726405-Pyramimonas_sp.AAC.1
MGQKRSWLSKTGVLLASWVVNAVTHLHVDLKRQTTSRTSTSKSLVLASTTQLASRTPVLDNQLRLRPMIRASRAVNRQHRRRFFSVSLGAELHSTTSSSSRTKPGELSLLDSNQDSRVWSTSSPMDPRKFTLPEYWRVVCESPHAERLGSPGDPAATYPTPVTHVTINLRGKRSTGCAGQPG